MTKTLNIKAGDWICLANGATDGPMMKDGKGKFFGNLMYYKGGQDWHHTWGSSGQPIDPNDEWTMKSMCAIATLPASPLDHIRALEARVEKLETALRFYENQANYIVSTEGKSSIDDDFGATAFRALEVSQ